jgi:hypothetical protein
LGGRGAEPGLTGSRESQVRPPPCQRAKENGFKTANCSWIGTSRSPFEELFDPPDGEPPEKERPPAGASGAGGGGGGAAGVGGGKPLSAGDGASVGGAFASLSAGPPPEARSPTMPAAKSAARPVNPLPILSTRSNSPPPRSGIVTNRSSTVRPSPLTRRPAAPPLGGGPGSVTAADATADAAADAVAEAAADAPADAEGCSGATLAGALAVTAAPVAASRLGSVGPGSGGCVSKIGGPVSV